MTRIPKGARGFMIVSILAIGITMVAANINGCSVSDNPAWSPTPPPPTAEGPTLQLNSNIAVPVAGMLVRSIIATFDFGDFADMGLPLQANGINLGGAALKTKENYFVQLALGASPGLNHCSAGGTVDIAYTVADPNTVTVGDQIVAVFDHCDHDLGYVVSGTIDMTVSDVQGDIQSDLFLLAMDVVMTDVLIEGDPMDFEPDGSFTLTLNNLEFPKQGVNVAGAELGLGGSHFSAIMDFDHDLVADSGVEPRAITASASGEMEALWFITVAGSIRYDTPIAIQASGDDPPHAGEILITGARDSTVRIVIVDSDNVTLEVDKNGDGVIDDYIYTNWNYLDGTSTITTEIAPILAREAFNAVTGFGLVTTIGPQFMPDALFGQIDQTDIEGDFGPVEFGCAISGNASVSGHKASTDGYTVGDELSANYSWCERSLESLDGQLRFTVDTYNGEGSVYAVSGTATEEAFQRRIGGSCFGANGTFDMHYDSKLTTPNIIVTAVSGAEPFFTDAGGRFQILSNPQASTEILVAQPTPRVTQHSSGTIENAIFDVAGEFPFWGTGAFDYESLSPSIFDLDDDATTGPYAGELLITADDGSTMLMVALDELNLRLDIDSNGDGVIDDEIFTTWAELSYDDSMCL